jgi:Cu(I)/Ag(I) efflux system membrane fusion protein
MANTAKLIVTALVSAALGAGAVAYLMQHRHAGMDGAPPAGPSSPTAAGERIDLASGRRVLYWHDPMYPQQRFDKPGKSPFMDMQLVPVYADEAADDGKVTISPRLQQNLGVRTAEAVKGSLEQKLEAVGSIGWNERDVAVLQARVAGFVEKLHARAPLDRVAQGQPLAELYAPEWVAAQEEYLAVRRLSGADRDALAAAARGRMLLAGMSEEQVRQVEASGQVQPRYTLRAPIAGVIAELGAREGMTVMPGTTLFRINGLGTVWANAEVPEAQAALVRPGNAVEARTPAFPEAVFKGRISTLLPEVNPATRTIKARVELANPGGRLTPGMFATVDFTPVTKKDALLVPTEAVIRTGSRTVVIVAREGGSFQPIEVETGAEAGGRTEIRKGLQAGQKVVVSGQFLIDSEASLKATAMRMSEAAQAEPPGGRHRGEGRLEQVGADAVIISHGPIPTMEMGAMTMEFKHPAGGLPGGLKAGATVSFEFQLSNAGELQLTRIAPLAQGAPKPIAKPEKQHDMSSHDHGAHK